MSNDQDWNDETRDELRETIRRQVLGSIRLANSDREDILETCQEVYIEDEAPDAEQDDFIRFAGEEFDTVLAQHVEGQRGWPAETDCDRLDRVEAALREQGILLWQVSPCCDSCSGSELPDRIDVIDERHPGFRDRVRGYSFFIDQNMPEMLADDTEISVYLAYGWFSADDSDVAPEEYEKKALGIAREICDCLRANGFEPDWDGDFSKKIGVSLNWQRRTPLQ